MDTWNTALASAETAITGAPFTPGDRVLLRRDPYHSWIVDHSEPHPAGGFIVHMGVGNVVQIGPANDLLLCPPGFEDAPAMPMGSVAHGLSERARQAKLDHDMADPLYRADMRCWHRAMIAWLTRWRNIVGEEQAELGIAFHRGQLAEMVGDVRQAAE